jgi:molybdopterin adenylyltransferase
MSDRAFRGDYEDLSGPAAREIIANYFHSLNFKAEIQNVLLPDDADLLYEKMKSAPENYDIIITTGGTGIGPRDITVDTIKPMLTKEIPGVMEYIRIRYGADKPNALLSRGVAGIIGNCLVYTLPGSVRAVNEYLTEITRTLEHSIMMLYGIDKHGKD